MRRKPRSSMYFTRKPISSMCAAIITRGPSVAPFLKAITLPIASLSSVSARGRSSSATSLRMRSSRLLTPGVSHNCFSRSKLSSLTLHTLLLGLGCDVRLRVGRTATIDDERLGARNGERLNQTIILFEMIPTRRLQERRLPPAQAEPLRMQPLHDVRQRLFGAIGGQHLRRHQTDDIEQTPAGIVPHITDGFQ